MCDHLTDRNVCSADLTSGSGTKAFGSTSSESKTCLDINFASNGFSRVQAVTVTSKHLLTEPAKQKTLAVHEQMSATDGSMEKTDRRDGRIYS